MKTQLPQTKILKIKDLAIKHNKIPIIQGHFLKQQLYIPKIIQQSHKLKLLGSHICKYLEENSGKKVYFSLSLFNINIKDAKYTKALKEAKKVYLKQAILKLKKSTY